MDAADALPPPRLHPSGAEPVPPAPAPRALRVVAWRGRADVALVVPRPGASPTPADVDAAVGHAARRGARQVVTGALAPAEVGAFSAVGFAVHEHLHLLRHDLIDLDDVPPVRGRLRRARRRDHDPALVVDARAFDPFWRLDRGGLDEAVRATTSTRFRVAADPDPVGYAITGRAGDHGYLQRLAVDPGRRGEGLGRALVLDGLHWLRRRHARDAVVNTQIGNDGALRLYRHLGFVLQPEGLTVLARATGR